MVLWEFFLIHFVFDVDVILTLYVNIDDVVLHRPPSHPIFSHWAG